MEQAVQIHGITMDDFREEIRQILSERRINPHETQRDYDPNKRVTRRYIKETFDISYPTIHSLMNSGKLPYSKAGRKTLFKLSDVEKVFDQNSI